METDRETEKGGLEVCGWRQIDDRETGGGVDTRTIKPIYVH